LDLQYYQEQAQTAVDDESRNKAEGLATETDLAIKELEAARAFAEKEAARQEESNKNNQKLLAIAQEIAVAKDATDEVINGLYDA
jgi:hypothetical protein